ncbi:NAD(P)H-dependent oxidoreductase [Paenibacillus sp. sptzw28]|uniref:NADPH-dependent FMN reductase n=1 Tax=Paenibacillus sp. sptzw28 TaxID=715179 RepID=UPI001C6E523F|nr:NADPH-dependent FMN reductase [Paenibacillus sp. sptzw28]QYR20354.1 NAD(P)H-dependent oxidoreductase [Paenibacillus sp. sptzw28]
MHIAIITGSNRAGAASTRVSQYLMKLIEEKGHQVSFIDLYERRLPLYSPDDTELHAEVAAMSEAVLEADAIVLSTPEYHGSVSGVLKNALDYLGFDHFDGKAVLSVSAAGGPVGVSSLQHLQTIVRNVHGINCPEWISVGGAQREFAENGEPAGQDVRLRVTRTLNYFLEMAAKLQG